MDRFLETWIAETIDNSEKPMKVKISRIRLRDHIYSLIANYRAPAWNRYPSKQHSS